MLCPTCRRHVPRDAAFCERCGRAFADELPPLELVLADGTRIPADTELTIGRAASNAIRIDDSAVSRHHAVVRPAGPGEAEIEDAGSSYGTTLDGEPVTGASSLHDGSQVRLGDTLIVVERRRSEAQPGRTMIVRTGDSVVLPAAGGAVEAPPISASTHPRLRPGWALKRLDAGEGDRRFVLRDLEGDEFLRMAAPEAALLLLLDGSHTMAELVAVAERRYGAAGPAALARLLADLGDHGLLVGVAGREPAETPRGRLARLAQPHVIAARNAGDAIDRLYTGGAWILFTRVALTVVALVCGAGLAAFAYLVIGRYGTPFVVAKKVGIGGLVFLAGRFAIAVVHEFAHALTLASFGRRAGKMGLKRILIFPYVFVETTEAWFEPRPHRITVSAAGPVSDLTFGGVFALVALVLDPSTVRDVFFQLALAAYIGAFFNLNPLLDRDGYAMLVDELGEPGLRRRGREQLVAALAGAGGSRPSSRAATIYGFATIGWSVVGIGMAAIFSLRYYSLIESLIGSPGLTRALFAAVYVAMAFPIAYAIMRPMLARRTRGAPDVVDG
jgi:putative peptide zinc metalloprotease protein